MNEALGWTMTVGLAVAIAAISMLSLQVEQQTRAALEATLRSVMARLQEKFNSRPRRISERSTGVKRRSTGKRAGSARMAPERRALARRRLEDVFPSLKTRRSGI